VTDGQHSIIYRINLRDEILFVNDIWNQVVSAHSDSSLLEQNILGRAIWEFINDNLTRDFYKEIIQSVRRNKPARFNFRCDSPSTRRLMEMDITRQTNEQVQFESKIIRAEKRPFQRMLDSGALRSDKIIISCSWCKKVNIEKDIWLEIEDAVSAMGIFENAKLPNISHGICKECYKTCIRKLDEEREAL
jgi:hypothetical protein